MSVRRWFPPLQSLFAAALFLGLLAESAPAQDVVFTKDGRSQTVEVQGVSGSNLQVKVGAGTIGIPLANVARVQMKAPAGYAKAVAAFQKRDLGTALAETRVLADKYRGLPTDWARQLNSMLGDIYVALGKYEEAESAYANFEKAYPGAGSTQSAVGRARIAVAQEKWDEARKLVEPVTQQALAEKDLTQAPVNAYSQAFNLLGQIEEHEGNLEGALEDYLRTVAIFHHDPAAVAEAQTRADALRQQNTALVVP